MLTMKKIFALLTLVLALAVCQPDAAQPCQIAEAAAGDAITLADEAGLLKPSEEKAVMDALNSVNARYNVNLAVVTVEGTEGMETGQFANALLDSYVNGGANGNMVLLVDMKTRHWYIATDNKMRKVVTDDYGYKEIGGAVAEELKSGNYSDAFIKFAQESDEYLAFYKENGRGRDSGDETPVIPFCAAVVGAIVIFFGYRSSLIASMSNVEPARSAEEYLKQGSFELTGESDLFLGTRVIVTPRPKNKGGGGFSSSDGSHGGGGGSF